MKSQPDILNLKRLFYAAIGIQIALFVAIAFKVINILVDPVVISIAVERYTLLTTLLSIPGALKLFSVIMNKNRQPQDNNLATAFYKKAFIARFSILFLVASLNIVLYAISFNQNFMLLTLITFIAYIFSYPSESYLKVNAEDENQRTD